MTEDTLHLSKESLVGRLEAVDRVVGEFNEYGERTKEGVPVGRPDQCSHC